MPTDEPTPAIPPVVREIPIDWPDEFKSEFANTVTAQIADGMLFVGFYQIKPPMLTGSHAEQWDKFQQATLVPAVPVVRVALPVQKLKAFIRLLEGQLSNSAIPHEGNAGEHSL